MARGHGPPWWLIEKETGSNISMFLLCVLFWSFHVLRCDNQPAWSGSGTKSRQFSHWLWLDRNSDWYVNLQWFWVTRLWLITSCVQVWQAYRSNIHVHRLSTFPTYYQSLFSLGSRVFSKLQKGCDSAQVSGEWWWWGNHAIRPE